MQLARVRRGRAWIVVEPGGEDVLWSASTPAVRFSSGKGITVVGFEIAGLGAAEPLILALQ